MLQSLNQSLINKLVEKCHFFRSILQHIVDNIFEHALSKHHVIFQICKGNFRLNHPELRSMACRVGILCAEGRSKGVDIFERHRIGLTVELTTYRKIRRLIKEILTVIDLSICHRKVVQIQCCDLEHLTCAFTVASRNQWCMNIYEISLLKELVNRVCTERAHSEYCLEGVCTRS